MDEYNLPLAEEAGALAHIIGTYECKMDNKGRFLMPVSLRKQLTAVLEEGFVLKRSVFRSCLELYPMAEWRAVMQKVMELNRFVKKNNDFIRLFTAGVKQVEGDASGRVLIAPDLIQFANLDKSIVLSSSVDILEIWDKQQYEETIRDTAADFSQLAEEVMGSIRDDVLS